MMFKILLVLSAVSFAAPKGEKINRSDLKKRILAGCMELSKDSGAADKNKQTCNCVVENFDKKANDYQLKLLAENYTGKKSSIADKEIYSSTVQSFDYEVAEGCLKDPNWRIKSK
jgi:hypothetical protein